MKAKRYLIAVMLAASQLILIAQSQKVSSQGVVIGHRISLFSEVLNEQRDLLISLPNNYDRNIHQYPVILVLDGEYLFELTRSIVNIKSSRNEMPESIVIGIPNTADGRYDMAMELRFPDGGGFFGDADGAKINDYLSFLAQEVVPFIENRYRVNHHQTIIGMSPTFGPVLQSFWDEPDLFNAHIVLAAEVSLTTSSGETVKEKLLKAIQDTDRQQGAIYIGKAGDDLKRRPEAERLAYAELNEKLENTANPNINYRIEILEEENHYGMAIAGIEHGLENIYPPDMWTVPYRAFWNSEDPASELKRWYDQLSDAYGFEIIPLEDAFYAGQTLKGTARRLNRQGRKPALLKLLELAVTYYPNSPELKAQYENAKK
ncbi:MAG: alpha/beta hydrolase-fold protein [Cytophagales bacterium]|nr:alpha/beta hydrolase-fold protein [Cytophagales bacterium]